MADKKIIRMFILEISKLVTSATTIVIEFFELIIGKIFEAVFLIVDCLW